MDIREKRGLPPGKGEMEESTALVRWANQAAVRRAEQMASRLGAEEQAAAAAAAVAVRSMPLEEGVVGDPLEGVVGPWSN